MTEEIEKLLPMIIGGQIPDPEIQEINNRIKLAIKEDPAKGKEYGELLGRVKQATRIRDIRTDINWVRMENGYLAIGHKPGGKVPFEGLKKEGTSAVVTLLHENEGASDIGRQLKNQNIEWIWFPFSASNPHDGENIQEVHVLYDKLSSRLKEGGRIYIHCSAGIHRTGMITYGLLRYLDNDEEKALRILQLLREVTAEQAGQDRLAWGNQFKRK